LKNSLSLLRVRKLYNDLKKLYNRKNPAEVDYIIASHVSSLISPSENYCFIDKLANYIYRQRTDNFETLYYICDLIISLQFNIEPLDKNNYLTNLRVIDLMIN